MNKLEEYLKSNISDYSINGTRCDKETYEQFTALKKHYKVSNRPLIIALVHKAFDELKDKTNG